MLHLDAGSGGRALLSHSQSDIWDIVNVIVLSIVVAIYLRRTFHRAIWKASDVAKGVWRMQHG